MKKSWKNIVKYSYWINLPLAFIIAANFMPTSVRCFALGLLLSINLKKLYNMWKAVN